MDLKKELRAFVRSDMPLRQTREAIRLDVRAWKPGCADRVWRGWARDLSCGGLGVALDAGKQDMEIGQEIVLEILLPEDSVAGKETAEPFEVRAKVAWVRSEEGMIVGFEFQNLKEGQQNRLKRYLMSQIIQRTVDEE